MVPTAPQSASGLVREALEHHQAGRLAEAEELYQQALGLEPGHADALHLLGMVAFQSGQLERAAELIRSAIASHPKAAIYCMNLGNVLQAQADASGENELLEQAAASYRQAIALRPGLAEAYLNLGHILQAQGNVQGALAHYRQAQERKPGLAEACVAESMVMLLQGDFQQGWAKSEFRWQTRDFETPMRTYAEPQWNGERLEAGRLLLWGEQGIGDEILFAGLIPDVVRTRNSIVLDCDPRLQRLFQRSFPGVEVVGRYEPGQHGAIGAHLPAGSLPRLYRASWEAFSATTSPYLLADPAQREELRARYGEQAPLRVGLAWSTRNPKTGRRRSMPLAGFAPLFELPGIQWISLQYGNPDELAAQLEGTPVLLDRNVDQLADIDRFAAQVAALDLVLTIDNSTAHLAGALGVPTWLLLPFAPNWRWLLETDRSPWYPTLRLFRQAMPGDWSGAVERVRTLLSSGKMG